MDDLNPRTLDVICTEVQCPHCQILGRVVLKKQGLPCPECAA